MTICGRPTAVAAGCDPEYELVDTGAFADGRYWVVEAEWAKAGPEDLVWRITATNQAARAGHPRSPAHHLVPQPLELGHDIAPAVPHGGRLGHRRRPVHRSPTTSTSAGGC